MSDDFVPSKYQSDFFDFVEHGQGNAILDAKAGSGKTLSIVKALKYIPSNKRVLFCAFNTNIAKELRNRVPRNVFAQTVHSTGFSSVKKTFGKDVPVDRDKLYKIYKDLEGFEDLDQKLFKLLFSRVKSVCDLVRINGIVPKESQYYCNRLCDDDDEIWLDIIDGHDINYDNIMARMGISKDAQEAYEGYLVELTITMSRMILVKEIEQPDVVDFTDMLYIPVVRNLSSWKYDVVFVDESQDLSPIQRETVDRAIKRSGRLVAVGDPNQAINYFAGASCDSMDQIREKFDCTTLPLSISYRCPKSVIREAQKLVPDIEAAPWAEEGIVEKLGNLTINMPNPGDMVICRVNSHLVWFACRLFVAKIPFKFIGNNFEKGLVSLVNRISSKENIGIQDFCSKLTDWYRKEVEKAEEKGRNSQPISDKYEALLAIIDTGEIYYTDDLIEKIEDVFKTETQRDGEKSMDEKDWIVLSSIHRCVTLDTFVESDKGISKIVDLESEEIATPEGIKRAYKTPINHNQSIVRIKTKRKYELACSLDHGLTVWNGEEHTRRNASDLKVGDIVRLRVGSTISPSRLVKTPPPLLIVDRRAKIYNVPVFVDEDFAEFLGMFVADGTLYKAGFRLKKRYQSSVDRFGKLCKTLFDVPVHYGHDKKNTPYCEVNSTCLSKWLHQIPEIRPCEKMVPDLILKSPLNVQKSFIRGIFEDGSVNHCEVDGLNMIDHIHFDSAVKEIAKTVQYMLLKLGIVSSIAHRKYDDKKLSTLYIYSIFGEKFSKEIGFSCKEKNERAKGVYSSPESYYVPVSKDEVKSIKRLFDGIPKDYYNTLGRGKLSFAIINKIESLKGVSLFQERRKWLYEKITHIEKDEADTMCLEVPDGGRFLQNGFDGYNSKGLEADTIWFLSPGLCEYFAEHPRTSPEQKQQEYNLKYVAQTRAKKALYYVYKPQKEKQKESVSTTKAGLSSILSDMTRDHGIKPESKDDFNY